MVLVPLQDDKLEDLEITDLSTLPDNWRVVQLGKIADVQYGKARPKTEGNVPVVGSGGVYAWADEALIQYPTLVVGRKGSAGSVWFMEKPCWPSDTTFYLEWKQPVDVKFLYGYLTANPLSGEHAKTTLPSLQRPELEDCLIPLPPLPEQRRIAHVLNTIQREIEVQDQLIAGAQELKRSLMHHLFTYGPVPVHQTHQVELQNTEIGPVPAHWVLVKLEHLIDSGPQNGLYKPASEYGEGTPILRIDAFSAGDTIGPQRLKRVRLSDDEVSKYSLASGDIVINRVNGSVEILGKCALVGGLVEPTVFESNMIRFAVDTELILNQFALHFLVSPQAREQIRTKARVVHQASINQQDLKSILVPLPDLSEQTAVVRTFWAVDRKIEIEESRRAALETLFNSMLHQLMTGQLRVV